ncbi:MAG: DUF362 domain-containing protein [Desulfovibrionaceae bacterium]|nr:DUF362 domain-containing protein [Desulfovibrionaceae bacterium]
MDRQNGQESGLSRRHFLAGGAAALGMACAGAALPADGAKAADKPLVAASAPLQAKPKVFYTREITDESLLKIYGCISQCMTGKVAIKLHTGEPGAPNLPPRHLAKALQASVPNSTIVECNVLYPGPRHDTASHRKLLVENGWTFCPVDIMDEDGDVALPIPDMDAFFDQQWGKPGAKGPFTVGNHLREIRVGRHLLNYDSLLVYTHFKGHASGGYGGSLKNIAIGCASPAGKRQQHGDGWIKGALFQEHMVEAAKGIVDHFSPHIAYINLMINMSVDCDCAGLSAAKPKCPDLGILASTDLTAVDQASVDMVYAMPEKYRKDLVERIESRAGLRQLEFLKILGMGTGEYELVEI